MRTFVHFLLPSCTVILLGGGALWMATDGFRAFTEEGARRLYVAENRPAIPLLALEDMNGNQLKLLSKSESSEKVTLVEFIYTSCPTICQTAGSEFARLRDSFSEAGLGELIRMISVSFDPLHDPPAKLREYATNHGADGTIWTIARVNGQDLDLMNRSFGLRVIPDGMGGYQHNAAIHLIDRTGNLSSIFNIDDVSAVSGAVRSKLQ